MIDEELKIWAAGFFDGEGTALISENNPGNYCVVVAVGNTDRRPIDIFEGEWAYKGQWMWKGWKRTRRTFVPKEYYRDHGSNARRGAHQLWFNYPDAEQLLLDLRPYLVVKAEEVDLVLRAIGALKKTGSRLVYQVLQPFYEEQQTLQANREGRHRNLQSNTLDVLRKRLKSIRPSQSVH